MSRICHECKEGRLEVVGMGDFEDTIILHCNECDEEYELEPDGLDEGGFELVEAYELEMARREGACNDD